jgi:hypothetical protein
VNAGVRVVAGIVGLLLLLLAAATLAAEVVAVVHRAYVWPYADLWARLTVQPTLVEGGLAALGAALVGIALLVLAARSLGTRQRGPTLVTLETPAGTTNVEVQAIERVLRRRLEASLPLKVRRVELGESGGGCSVRVEADVTALDLTGLQRRAVGLLAGDLERLAGMRLEALDLIVGRLLLPPVRGSQRDAADVPAPRPF